VILRLKVELVSCSFRIAFGCCAALMLTAFQSGCITTRSDMLREINADMGRIQQELNSKQTQRQQMTEERRRVIEEMNAKLREEAEQYEPAPALQPTAPGGSVLSTSIDAPSILTDTQAGTAFRRAQAFYNRGDYKDAAEEFVLAYRYAGEENMQARSLYWLGESYYRLRDWERAISCFNKFETEFSQHKLASAAQLKKGFSLLQDGQTVSGRATLRILIETYPGSAEAPLAEQRLKETE